MTKFFANFLRDESGASAAEYVILTGVMGALVAGGAFAFGGKLKSGMSTSGDKIVSCAAPADGATTC
ncbi:Flp family type IVb pilin [Novosphingobium taihuense]|uniref:Pilus assembly protein Flp/PilA n=1 Tax=Novosphingobium taihuense TaxID=260085 RepID=A0A7W7EW34_9SPHN|nr:Flp family type IVb pilin [Novosphingobium taihuense]MBB4615661.1 pilus assembly protein Flp/PilA [Novosphingobium taihuense]TWH79593.1 pilus assembly protein Flp/PilA [Novosphingobium taihuense]